MCRFRQVVVDFLLLGLLAVVAEEHHVVVDSGRRGGRGRVQRCWTPFRVSMAYLISMSRPLCFVGEVEFASVSVVGVDDGVDGGLNMLVRR